MSGYRMAQISPMVVWSFANTKHGELYAMICGTMTML